MTTERGSRLLTRKTVHPGRTVHLDLERVELPNGHVVELEIVHHPGAACVVALTNEGHVLLVRQFRHAVGGWLVEVPAGKLEKGELPETCAARELEEETGFRATRIEKLGSIVPTPGFCDEVIHVFRAAGLLPGRQAHEESENMSLLTTPFAEALAMVADGRIRDGKTIAALTLASLRGA